MQLFGPTDVAGRAVGLRLRQSVERIGRLREAALRHVRRLLADPLVRPHVPHAAAVAAAVAAASEAAAVGSASASLEALQRVVVQLLPVAPYTGLTGYLLEGLAASIGGVDNSLAKVASAALLEALASGSDGAGAVASAAADGGAGAGASGSGSGSGSGQAVALAALVSGHFLDIWARHAKSSRMATPLLRTALLLLTKAPGAADTLLPRPLLMQAAAAVGSSATDGEADSVSTEPAPAPAPAVSSSARGAKGPQSAAEPQSRWVDHLVEAARAEMRGCGDVARLLEAAALLAHLAVVPPPRAGAAGGACGHCRSSALQGLMVLLCSRYPKVRRHAAEQLYMQLLAMDTAPALDSTAAGPAPATSSAAPPPPPLELVSDAACDLLLATAWDGDMEAAKAARDALAALVGVAGPKMKAPAASAKAAAACRDENASYQALMEDFARGY